MNILIKEVDNLDLPLINKCNSEFIVDSKLNLYIENEEIKFKIQSIPKYNKKYDSDNIDYSNYINSN